MAAPRVQSTDRISDPKRPTPGQRRLFTAGGIVMLLLAASVGTFAGAGMFAFNYGEGTSYFSDKPENCTNCHIMQPYFDSWVKSSHHAAAACVDCHLPHDYLGKYVAKADNGFFHSWAFTFENFHEPIQIKQRNRHIVQLNCVSCHTDIVHELLPATISGEAVSCVDCHASVGHAQSRPRSAR